MIYRIMYFGIKGEKTSTDPRKLDSGANMGISY